eukprot:15153854-Ditylum_brightwellii.AAC.1
MSTQNRGEQFQEICNNVNFHKIDYLGYPEINLDTTQQKVKRTLKNLSNVAFTHSSLQISSSPILAKHFYKPGGTLCLAQGDINSRKIDQGCDKYGQWCYMRFLAIGNKIITIMTTYQPCRTTKSTGTTTYHQQLSLQQMNNINTVNPCKSFINDLMKWMKAVHAMGEQYILAWDFN